MPAKSLAECPPGASWREGVQISAPTVQIGSWRVQPGQNLLIGEQGQEKVGRKVMELLMFLASRPGAIVGKDEIVAEVWEHRFVSETVLTVTVSHLRRALGDNAQAPQYLQTIHGTGYKFLIHPVALPPAPEPPPPKPVSLQPWRLKTPPASGWWWALALAVLAGWLSIARHPKAPRSAAIIPNTALYHPENVRILNLTQSAEGDLFTEIMTQKVAEALALFQRMQTGQSNLFGSPPCVEGALLATDPICHWKLKMIHPATRQVLWHGEAQIPLSEIDTFFLDWPQRLQDL